MRKLFILVFCILFSFPAQAVTEDACSKARSSADVMRCLDTQYSEAQKNLNKAFQAITLKAEPETLDTIKKIQNEWLEYRDLECEQETAFLTSESIKRIERVRCLNRLTRERTVALQKTMENEERHVALGESVMAQPRWMNALAVDHPDVFWRYGSRKKGDLDCDNIDEHAMLGLRGTSQDNSIVAVIAIAENPMTGRPQSRVLDLEVPEECGFLKDIEFRTLMLSDPASDHTNEEPTLKVQEPCATTLVLKTLNCPDQSVALINGEYTLGE